MNRRSDNILLLALFAAVVVGLYVIPRLVPANEVGVISAAAAEGYSTSAAFWTALAWFACAVLLFAARGLRPGNSDAVGASIFDNVRQAGAKQTGSLNWYELAAVFLVFSLAYFPIFLARHGPYMEDQYFLVALQRMACGQLPYADFEFLYGPLMIYPLWGWCQLFGTSMVSYFSFLALIEGLQFTILMALLQYFIPDRKKRYCVFLLLLPFLFNTLLGLNYNGLRRLLPVIALLLLAIRPYDRKANIGCAILIGFQLGYSHEYAIATVFAVSGVYAFAFLRGDRAESIRSFATILTLAIAVWGATLLLVVGDTLSAYAASVNEVVGMMSRGHAGFKFYWTANSLALFSLLTIVAAVIGRGIMKPRVTEFTAGDRFLLGAVLYALVMLKSGLTRADLWHLNAGFLALLVALLLSLPSNLFLFSGIGRKVTQPLIVLVSLTYLVGIAPTGSLYAESYLRGMVDTIGNRYSKIEFDTRSPSFEVERTEPRRDLIELGEYLAAPERAHRPVLFYGRAWVVAPLVGVCAQDYKQDDLMYSEFRMPESVFLNKNPDALIVIRKRDYELLYDLTDVDTLIAGRVMTPTKQLGRWLSTVHYDAANTESLLQDEARTRMTGVQLPLNYKKAEQFGRHIVLAPLSAEANNDR